ncbi:FAD-dependent oxidoreductase [Euzebya tangerina]|uniref:FAD-dependent oxidoreductase n=1 Tax=Euzebya tangerina TaxID=591198 RepID=UPI000E321F41|nr:FAD-dependent oxidoreductase [Euzebya tangerina]
MSDITVIGAGVIGLSTGIRLAEAGHQVRILTKAMPEQTTSAAATAMIGLAFAEPMDKVPQWEAATHQEMGSVMGEPASGVRRQSCLLGSRTSDALPPGIDAWDGFRLADTAELPNGFEHGFWIDMTVADMTAYLPYLTRRFGARGGALEMRDVASLAELGDGVVVNCSGLGARVLADDDTITGQWGMHVVVRNPGVDATFMEGPPGQAQWVAWMPHGDRVLIGGVLDPDRDFGQPDAAVGDQLLAAAVAANPTLAGAEVLGMNGGLRPARPVIRVERDPDITPQTVVHNYGHGSLGVTLSWGCADEVVTLLGQ